MFDVMTPSELVQYSLTSFAMCWLSGFIVITWRKYAETSV